LAAAEPGQEAWRERHKGACGPRGRGKGERERRRCSGPFSKRHSGDLRGGGSGRGMRQGQVVLRGGLIVAARGGEKGARPWHQPKHDRGGQRVLRKQGTGIRRGWATVVSQVGCWPMWASLGKMEKWAQPKKHNVVFIITQFFPKESN
jgi:hypothetical protein